MQGSVGCVEEAGFEVCGVGLLIEEVLNQRRSWIV